jgi:hypothetical protein
MDTNISEEQADTIFRFKVSRVRIWPGYMDRLQGMALLRTTAQSPGKDIESDMRQPFFAPQKIPSRNKNGLFNSPAVTITAGNYTRDQTEI